MSGHLTQRVTWSLAATAVIITFWVGVLWFNLRSKQSQPQTTTPTTLTPTRLPQAINQVPQVDINSVSFVNEPFIGDPQAPVTMAYWMDFQCPLCKRFETQTLPVLKERYIDTGRLRVVFKDFQFLGADSQTAGLIANAIWELYPDLYFRWHELMYQNQDEENGGFGDSTSIFNLIKTSLPEIDVDKVSRLVKEKADTYQQEQDEDKAEGRGFGLRGTPGFVIGQQTIKGAQPTKLYIQLIEAQLNNS